MIGAALLQVIAQEANRIKVRVQDLFVAYLYTSVGGARTIVNGIDLAAHGGLVWARYRSAEDYHAFFDSARGITEYLLPQSAAGAGIDSGHMGSFNTNGYTMVGDHASGTSIVSNCFRKAPKFFDMVTYTGTGVARTIAHNLGVAPGLIIVKKRNGIAAWRVYHRSLGIGNVIEFNTLAAVPTTASNWNGVAPTDSAFSLGTDTAVNNAGDTYVAYLFAHDPAGIIQCGSYTGNGSASGPTVTLGWEPQWLLIKRSSEAGSEWQVVDSARGFAAGADKIVTLSSMTAETTADVADPSSTGFTLKTTDVAFNAAAATYLYMAIRKGT